MCGICGIWGEPEDSKIEAMVDAMHHRGPDDHGFYRDERVALGMTRLAVIDVSAAGHQPMKSSDSGIWIVFNGEVYNFQSERRILEKEGYSFSSSSDTEVVLNMYEHYGDDFLLRIRGMFALAIYDRRRGPGHERLLLARDCLGVKPLLFSRNGSQLVFASEMRALLASGLADLKVDPVALRHLLVFGSVYQPRTMLFGVKMLMPAHRMIIEQNNERIERYWSLGTDRRPGLRKQSYGALVSELSEVLSESIRLHLVSDVPVGAFLSGGVDSSILVAIMAQTVGRRVKTFSVGFEGEGADIDESGDAQKMANFLGTDHTQVLVKGIDVRDRICHIASSLDQPSVDGVNSYFVSLAANQGVKVALSGTGGDELFAGYPWFISMIMQQEREKRSPCKSLLTSFVSALARHSLLDPLMSSQWASRLDDVRTRVGFLSKYSTNYRIFDAVSAAKLLSLEIRKAAQAGRAAHHDLRTIDELSGSSTIDRVSGLCLRGYTSNQLLRDIDAVSMAHSLEVRVPYLDRVVVDAALSLPAESKLGNPRGFAMAITGTYRETGAKRILIDVGRSFLPKDFDLQPKRGFHMPFEAWLRGPLKEVFCDTVCESNIRKRGLLEWQEAKEVRRGFLEGHLAWARPWLLMILELWCQEVLDKTHVTGRGCLDKKAQ